LSQALALAGADRAGFHDDNLVADLGFVLFVVGHELLADRVLLAVQRVRLAVWTVTTIVLSALSLDNDAGN
jgi:hypothetical protein